ncbi:MAG: hypothetical protein M5U28_49290 [Sandaracinaceae bacterium]|nr:hypothetical protein [Sandaracinaceae bacterium]
MREAGLDAPPPRAPAALVGLQRAARDHPARELELGAAERGRVALVEAAAQGEARARMVGGLAEHLVDLGRERLARRAHWKFCTAHTEPPAVV